MYSLKWARDRVNEHSMNHTRATEILEGILGTSVARRCFFLATGDNRWEGWKYLVRMTENTLRIRAFPNMPGDLNTKRVLGMLDVLLDKTFKNNPPYLLTALEEFVMLYEQFRVGEPRTGPSIRDPIVPDDGQLELSF